MNMEEIQVEGARLIGEADAILTTDTVLTGNKRAQWGAYRQKVIDLLDQGLDPAQVVFPTPPAGGTDAA